MSMIFFFHILLLVVHGDIHRDCAYDGHDARNGVAELDHDGHVFYDLIRYGRQGCRAGRIVACGALRLGRSACQQCEGERRRLRGNLPGVFFCLPVHLLDFLKHCVMFFVNIVGSRIVCGLYAVAEKGREHDGGSDDEKACAQ